MATSTTTRDLLASSTGLSPAWISSLLRILQEVGLIPVGKRGGGRAAVHYDSRQFAIVMLGLMAPRLADAVAAVTLLKDLPFHHEQPAGQEAEPYAVLLDQIANWIEGAAVAHRLGKPWDDGSLRRLRAWNLDVCLETASAYVVDEFREGERVVTAYSKRSGPSPGLRRHTILNGNVLLAFGELWADTQLERERAAIRKASAKAASENENAGSSPKEPASVTNQSPAKGSEAVASSDTNGGVARGEASSRDRTDHDSDSEPDLFHHAGSARCLTLM